MFVTLTPIFFPAAFSAAARLVVSSMPLIPCCVNLMVVMKVAIENTPLKRVDNLDHSPHPPHLLRRLLRIERCGIERPPPFQHLLVLIVLGISAGGEVITVAPRPIATLDHQSRLLPLNLASNRRISRYIQISVTSRLKPPYHSMYLGACCLAPCSMK